MLTPGKQLLRVREKDLSNKKIFYFLPNIFTALNLACGFVASILAWKSDFYNACIILLLGSIFDSVDGKVARLTGTSSSFGEQFDSMSDVISFGLAPSFIAYNYYFKPYGRIGIVIPFIFLLCGALRLARFNSNIDRVDSNFFQGLPSPAGALGIVGMILFSLEFEILQNRIIFPGVLMVGISILMISNIPFNSFKNSPWVKKNKKYALMILLASVILTISYLEVMIGLVIFTYIGTSLFYFFLKRGELKDVFKWSDP